MTYHITLPHTSARLFTFTDGHSVCEYQLIIQCTQHHLHFSQQLSALMDAYQHIISQYHPQPVAVFKRYFLSDAANQADEVLAADACDCPKSIIQQPPLDGSKIALWAYLMTDVTTHPLSSDLYAVDHGCYRHLWNAGAHNLASNSEYQTRLLFNEYVMQLAQERCTLAANCIRTWLFVNDIDLNYSGVVRARNQVFFTQGLTTDTHFIASTGIGGRQQNAQVLMQMDDYAIAGIRAEQVRHLYAPTHLNRTSDYGVSFERGTMVDYGDRRHVFISGTASINNKGEVVHPRDIVSQTHRMWDNVEALLQEAECNFSHIAQLIVYLRDSSDYEVVSELFAKRFPDTPYVIVLAPVCRPEWLIEMECMAVRAIRQEAFSDF